jgi:hypothetical protein
MPSTLNPRAPRFSTLACDGIAMGRDEALAMAHERAMTRGRQSVRPARDESRIVAWLVQDVRFIAPRPEVHDEVGEQVHAS